MIVIEVAELAEPVREALRRAREQGEAVEVVDAGEVVARLVPVRPQVDTRPDAAVWADLERLSAEISAHWPPGVSALDAVHDVRRDL